MASAVNPFDLRGEQQTGMATYHVEATSRGTWLSIVAVLYISKLWLPHVATIG